MVYNYLSRLPLSARMTITEAQMLGTPTVLSRRRFVAAAALLPSAAPAADWDELAAKDAKQDWSTLIFDGKPPNSMVCDTTLRELPDKTWILFMLAGGTTEPSPENYTAVFRSHDGGRRWGPLETFDTGFPQSGKTIGQGPTELLIQGKRCSLYFATHSFHWKNDWRSWVMHSDDSCRTWSQAEPLPGRLADRTFIRAHAFTRDGRILLPFQHYVGPEQESGRPPLERALTNPRNGVLISGDGGRTWTEHGNIRITRDDNYFGWAEPAVAPLSDGRVGMIIRGDKLGGVLYYAESADGGRTWPEFAAKSSIPNPGSKATLYSLGPRTVAMLHNPDPRYRKPLSLWISFDEMNTWPYQRVLVKESADGPNGRLNYPDGFVSRDRRWLYFAYDDNRHRAVLYAARLPRVR